MGQCLITLQTQHGSIDTNTDIPNAKITMRSYIISALGTLIATLVFLPLSAAQSFRNRVLNSRLVKSTGLWKYFSKRDGSYLTELEALHKQHGDIVQVGPREYSVVDPIELQILERRKALAKVSLVAW